MSNAYLRSPVVPAATVATTVLTVPEATTAIVKSFWVANDDAASTNITLTFSPSGTGTHVLIPLQAVPSKEYVDLFAASDAGPVVLEASDVLTVTSSQGNVFVLASSLLIDRS